MPVKLTNTFEPCQCIFYQPVVPDLQFSVVYEKIYKHILNQLSRCIVDNELARSVLLS